MSITILSRFPSNEQIHVLRNTFIFIGVTNAEGISPDTLRVVVGDDTAYEHKNFIKPDFNGEVVITDNYASIKIIPRRYFEYKEKVIVTATLSNNTAPPSEFLTDQFFFYTQAKLPFFINDEKLAPSQIRFMNPFPTTYLENLRQILRNTLSPNLDSSTVAIAYRLSQSVVKTLIVPLNLTVEILEDVDLNPLNITDTQLQKFSTLWENGLTELANLGVGPKTLDSIRRGYDNSYPQNRVGAACAVVLLAADYLQLQGL